MIPDASAGSNQAAAKVIVTAQVTCPSGPTALAGLETPISKERARTARMFRPERRTARIPCDLHRDADKPAETRPTRVVAMAFPLDSARRMPTLKRPLVGSTPRPRPHAQWKKLLLANGERPRRRFATVYRIANALPREERALPIDDTRTP